MKPDPLVSIIVRTHRRPQGLQTCLNSVARQSYPNIELVVVNDGGPSVGESVAEFQFEKIELIENSSCLGRAAAANLGIKAASGDYLGFLDDDDIFYPFHVSTLVKALISNNHKVVYSDALKAVHSTLHSNMESYQTEDMRLDLHRDFDSQRLLLSNYLPINSVLLEREIIVEDLLFDENLKVLEDWDFWIRLSRKYSFMRVPEITCEFSYRTNHSNSISHDLELWQTSRAYLTEKLGVARY